MSLSHSESETENQSETENKTRSSDTMNVESNGSHFLVGRSSPPPNPDLEMGQTSGRTRSQGASPMPRNSMQEEPIRPGPQVFVTPSAMHTGQRVFGGRAGTKNLLESDQTY